MATPFSNRMAALVLAVIMSLCLVPATAWASDGQKTKEERMVGTATDGIADPEPDSATGDMLASIFGLMLSGLEETEESDPLTPEGNLTLVDDIGNASGKGKQFLTVVTKTGNYFYIIIDRDDEGEGTVHFLNQVDERDIFQLLEEDEQEEYIQQMTEPQEPEMPEPTEPAEPEEPDESERKPTRDKRLINRKGLIGVLGLMALTVAGGGYYVVQNRKKKKNQNLPDPDEYYENEDYDDAADDVYDDEYGYMDNGKDEDDEA